MKKINTAFTLVELIVTLVVSVLVIGGIFSSVVYSLVLNDYNDKFSNAMNIAQDRLEVEIEKLRDNFDGYTPDTVSEELRLAKGHPFNGSIQIVSANVPGYDLVDIRVAVCWKMLWGRVIGGDTDLDGVVDSGESVVVFHGISTFASPCVLSTSIAKR